MATLRIEIDLGNAAFDDDPFPEVARILLQYARVATEIALLTCKLYDINGNRVGKAEIVP